MNRCYLGLGGNVGDVVTTMDEALDRLDADDKTRVGRVSPVFETSPVGSESGGRFLNAAAELDTDLDADKLLDILKAIERDLGRVPGDRWSARVVDLDLLLFGQAVIDRPGLVVPHPHLWYRRFVMDPLVEIAADVIHPQFEETLGQLRSHLLGRPFAVRLVGDSTETVRETASALRAEWQEPRVKFGLTEYPDESDTRTRTNGLRLALVGSTSASGSDVRFVDLATLPGSLEEAAHSVLAAALDEPRVHSRPLRRMP